MKESKILDLENVIMGVSKITDTCEVLIGNLEIIEIEEGHIYEAKRMIKNGTYRTYARYNEKNILSATNYAIFKACKLGYIKDSEKLFYNEDFKKLSKMFVNYEEIGDEINE